MRKIIRSKRAFCVACAAFLLTGIDCRHRHSFAASCVLSPVSSSIHHQFIINSSSTFSTPFIFSLLLLRGITMHTPTSASAPVRSRLSALLLTLAAFVGIQLVLTLSSCGKKDDQWAEAKKKAEQQIAARKEAVESGTAAAISAGANLNSFFPAAGDGFERVASQEKEGFAEYKLKKDGKDVAMLAISDITANPSAAEKFKNSTRKIGGFPVVDQGSTATAVLVADRFQVKVLTRDPMFTKADREAWLAKFNLAGLAAFKEAAKGIMAK
jgi:hypothetical protein